MASPRTQPDPSADAPSAAADDKRWICIICGWVYDEAAGLPGDGIAPGTRFEDIPDDWRCPLCGVGKSDFTPVGPVGAALTTTG